MNRFNPAEKFQFALCRNAAEGEGGGVAEPALGSAPAAAAGEALAGTEPAAPPATFLSEGLAPKPGEPLAPASADGTTPPVEGEKAAEAAPAFDLTTATLPEGFSIDEETGKGFAELLSKADLSPQERGQQLLDLHTKTMQETVTKTIETLAEANKETWTKMNNDWREAIKALPEFKADPDAEAGHVLQALATVGAGPEFFAALDLTGAGNHPAILQVLHRLTMPFREGGSVGGTAKPASTKQLGDNIYTSATKP